MEIEKISKIKDHVSEVLENVHRSINVSNAIKKVDSDLYNNQFFFGYPRNV